MRTRIVVLRAANKLSDDVDMGAVEEAARRYYEQALASGEYAAILVYDEKDGKLKFIGAGGVSFY